MAASPALINRSSAPSAGEVGLNIRAHTQRTCNQPCSQADLGPMRLTPQWTQQILTAQNKKSPMTHN